MPHLSVFCTQPTKQLALILLAAGDRSGRTLIPSSGKRTDRTRGTSAALFRVTRLGWGGEFALYLPNCTQSLILRELNEGTCLQIAVRLHRHL